MKRLFGLSGNVCAYPACNNLIIDQSGIVTGEICHIRAKRPSGLRYDPNQSDADRADFENLLLLCPIHHKVIDSDEAIYTVDLIKQMKSKHEIAKGHTTADSDTIYARMLLNKLDKIEVSHNAGNLAINSPGVIQANTINLVQRRVSSKIQPPSNSIGYDALATGYAEYLIKRYIEFASLDKTRRENFNPARFRKTLERHFKCHYRLLPLAQFEELQNFLHYRINNTIFGKRNKAKGKRTYSTFEEWRSR